MGCRDHHELRKYVKISKISITSINKPKLELYWMLNIHKECKLKVFQEVLMVLVGKI